MKLKLKNVFLAYFLVSIAGLLYALVQLGERGGAGRCAEGRPKALGTRPADSCFPLARLSGQPSVAPCLELSAVCNSADTGQAPNDPAAAAAAEQPIFHPPLALPLRPAC